MPENLRVRLPGFTMLFETEVKLSEFSGEEAWNFPNTVLLSEDAFNRAMLMNLIEYSNGEDYHYSVAFTTERPRGLH